LVFLFDVLDFFVRVFIDLLHGFFIVIHHGFDLLLKLCNLIFLDLNKIRMVLHFLVSSSRVRVVDLRLRNIKLLLLIILVCLQLLVPCGIFEHFLGVLTSLVLNFIVLLFS
jgi:hypothetical protein